MNARNLRAVGIVVLLIVLACVSARAGRDAESLPDAVKSAVNAEYPGAEIEEAQAEEECIVVYEVELEMDEDEEVELMISADGKIMEKETEISAGELPAAVKAAIEGACEGGEITEVTKEVTYWVVTLKKLDVPETTYEAEVVKDGEWMEIEVSADGKILSQDTEDEDEDEDD